MSSAFITATPEAHTRPTVDGFPLPHSRPHPIIVGARPGQAPPTPWAATRLADRLTWVRSLRRLLSLRADDLLHAVESEIHKPRWEALTSDLLPLLAACRWHERHAARLLSSTRLRGAPAWLPGQRWRMHRDPLGHVAIIATWNYPIQLLGVQMLQALLAGNTVTVKPSEHAPSTQQLLIDLFRQAGLPEGVLSVRPATREAGAAMLRDGTIDHLIFTGSTSVGRQVAAWAAENLVPTTLELSGADSALVLDDADPQLAANTIWHAVVLNGGQTCMAPRRVLVDRRVYAPFLAALAPLAAGAKPRQLISSAAASAGFEPVRQTLELDARAHSLSGVAESPVGPTVRPLVIVDCAPDAPLCSGQHFAPFVAVVPVDSLEHAIDIHASCPQTLATSVFTSNPQRIDAIRTALRSSLITVNDCVLPTGHPACAITGRGLSGWNSSRGREGLLAMTRPVQIGTSNRLLRPPLSPPLPKMAARLQRLMLRWYGGRL